MHELDQGAFLVSCLFDCGQYKKALVVNCECNMRNGGRVNPGCFQLTSADEVEWNFPAYTVGEAASATVFTHERGVWSLEPNLEAKQRILDGHQKFFEQMRTPTLAGR